MNIKNGTGMTAPASMGTADEGNRRTVLASIFVYSLIKFPSDIMVEF